MPDPKNKKKYNDPEFQKFLNQMRVVGVTESGNDYNAKNPKPGQTATGKYQYNKKHLPEIQKFSREIGMPIDTLEEFRQNPGLQEAYFTYDQYKGYEWAKKRLVSKNPFNYNMAELAMLRHFQGEKGADTILTTKTHRKADELNPGTKEYIEGRFRGALKNSGLYEPSGVERNRLKADSLTNEEKLKIQNSYFKEVDKIKKSGYDPVTENSLLNQLNQNYFDKGNLEIVNRKIDYRNNTNKTDVENSFEYKKQLAERFKGNVTMKDGGYVTDMKYAGNIKSDKELEGIAKMFGEKPSEVMNLEKDGAPFYDARDYYKLNPNSKTAKFLLNPSLKTLQEIEGSQTPRIDLSQYERIPEVYEYDEEANSSTDGSVSTDNVTSTSTSSSSAMQTPFMPPAPVKPTSFSDAEVMSMFEDDMFADEMFEYNKNWSVSDIPFEAIGQLAIGLDGLKKADSVDIPMRDEQISPALRNYAAELVKIKNMGLPPEKEAELNQNLASVYQTSLTNITRASGGNRNLVLGNQAQADLVRQKGLTDIALMDFDRRDKAMAMYGEIVKYMNDFDANRDIANHSIKYNEAMKEQQAGAMQAQAGFNSLIESLRYAKQNAPGSANHMYKQYLMYNISGINPGLDDDGSGTVPGTASYAKARRAERDAQTSEREKMKDFYTNMNTEDRKKFNTFMMENEHLRPDINKDVKFEDIKAKYGDYAGTTESKEEMTNEMGAVSEQNVITLNDARLNDESTSDMPMPQLGQQKTDTAPKVHLGGYNPEILKMSVDNKDEQVIDKWVKVNEDAENYLRNEGAKAARALDDTIRKTEEDTQKMEQQIRSIY